MLVVVTGVCGWQFAEQPRAGIEGRLHLALLVGVGFWLVGGEVNLEEPRADQRQMVSLYRFLDCWYSDKIVLRVPVLGIVGASQHRGDAVPQVLAGQYWWRCLGRPACALAIG